MDNRESKINSKNEKRVLRKSFKINFLKFSHFSFFKKDKIKIKFKNKNETKQACFEGRLLGISRK